MAKPTMVRVNTETLGNQVERVGELLAQIEASYRAVEQEIDELCGVRWVDIDSATLRHDLSHDVESAGGSLKEFRRFYRDSLTFIEPNYLILRDKIANQLGQL